VIFHGDLLTAVGGVAAGVGGAPGAGHIEGVPQWPVVLVYRVEYAEGRTTAGVAGVGGSRTRGCRTRRSCWATHVMVRRSVIFHVTF